MKIKLKSKTDPAGKLLLQPPQQLANKELDSIISDSMDTCIQYLTGCTLNVINKFKITPR